MLVHEVRGRRVVTVDIGIQGEERTPAPPGSEDLRRKTKKSERRSKEKVTSGRARR